MHGTVGRPPFKPTQSQRRRVEDMAAKGMSRSEITHVIDVGLSTPVKYFSDASVSADMRPTGVTLSPARGQLRSAAGLAQSLGWSSVFASGKSQQEHRSARKLRPNLPRSRPVVARHGKPCCIHSRRRSGRHGRTEEIARRRRSPADRMGERTYPRSPSAHPESRIAFTTRTVIRFQARRVSQRQADAIA